MIAKIDHIALEPGTDLLVEMLDGLLQGSSCLFIEGGDTNVAHVIIGFIFYRIDVDDIAHNLDVDGFFSTLAGFAMPEMRSPRPKIRPASTLMTTRMVNLPRCRVTNTVAIPVPMKVAVAMPG